MSYTKYFLLLFVLCIFSCKKDSDPDTKGLNFISSNAISGITETDVNGNYFGNIDTSDWHTNDLFAASINSHFNFNDSVDYTEADTSSILISEYPNPCFERFRLQISSSKKTVFKWIWVDSDFHVYTKAAFLLNAGSNQFMFEFDSSSVNKLYRFYYKLYDSNHINYASGHGDILKSN